MTRLLMIVALMSMAALVSACGADGEPEKPEPKPEPGLSVSGSAAVGIKF